MQRLLQRAAAKGDAAALALLEEGVGVQDDPPGGWSALHLAASNSHTRAVRRLLAAGASPTAATATGLRPLHVAAAEGRGAVVRLLLDSAPEVALQSSLRVGYTPFMAAAINGHLGVARLLLQTTPAASMVVSESLLLDGYQFSTLPMHMAAMADHTALLQLLLEAAPEAVAAPAYGRLNALHMAGIVGTCAFLRLLLAGVPAAAAAAMLGVNQCLPAAPAAAHIRCRHGFLPLEAALAVGNITAARALAAAAPATACEPHPANGLLPLQRVLQRALRAGGPRSSARAKLVEAARPLLAAMPPEAVLPVLNSPHLTRTVLPLFADLAAAWVLTEQQWAAVPKRCPGLGRALPAVLTRSEQQAAQLVVHLTPADRRRLRTVALSLARRQRRLRVSLPPVLLARILSHVLDTPVP